MNAVIPRLNQLEIRNYVRKAGSANYWVDWQFGIMEDKRKATDDAFCLIVYGSEDDEKDFFVIPYDAVRHVLTEANLVKAKEGDNRRRWIGDIREKNLKIQGTEIDLTKYYGNLQQLEDASHGLEVADATTEDVEDDGGKDEPKKSKNPPWQRDEIILALDLYVQQNGKYLSESHPDIIALSEVLNGLPIHSERASMDKFRNPNGVSMKLLNFRRFDPTQAGVGLTRGNKLEKEVWDDFAGQPERLHSVAEGIKAGYLTVQTSNQEDAEEETFPEGRILFRVHRQRERNRKVIAQVKTAAKAKHGRLFCSVCKFDFAAVYGKLGEDYIEGHHTKPLGELLGETETKVGDIALVCSNCHRMLHRKRPWLTIGALGSLLLEPT